MRLNITVTKENYYIALIEVLNPVTKLTFTEKNILAEYMKVYGSITELPEEEAKEILNSTHNRVYIRSKLKITEHAFNNHISSLKKKKVLIEGVLSKVLRDNIEPKSNKIEYEIDVQEL